MIGGGKIKYISLRDYLHQKGWKLIKPQIEEKNLIRGIVTYTNKKIIKGKVKIVENTKELSKIKKGDIIVAPMTTPEYGPVFSKVKAIITDEGGITSHAAIVSRELKIPCIVGTKIATQVLQDNNQVEIDMIKGIIKILN